MKQSPSTRLARDASEAAHPDSMRFPTYVSDYYSSLIDWDDPCDPLRALVAFDEREHSGFGSQDPSNESASTVLSGLQHKYRDTALLLVTNTCAGYCRYCFRKRLFGLDPDETLLDWAPALRYVSEDPRITDILLTGGDPLTLPTDVLEALLVAAAEIPHVRTIRIGSKVPAFDPQRIMSDPQLGEAVRRVVATGRNVYVMTHFDHPRELTEHAIRAVAKLSGAGAVCLNQCPVTRGINDDVGTLARLFALTTSAGCPQYYVFQCRPATGNAHFVLPLVRSIALVTEARGRVSGLSRRARLCASHDLGKIEFVGMDARHLYARFHRARNACDEGRMLVYRRDEDVFWPDELIEAN